MTEMEKTEKLSDILGNAETVKFLAGAENDIELQSRFAQNGLDLSIEEVNAFAAMMNSEMEDELNEEALDSVAGGVSLTVIKWGLKATSALIKSAKAAWDTGRMLAAMK